MSGHPARLSTRNDWSVIALYVNSASADVTGWPSLQVKPGLSRHVTDILPPVIWTPALERVGTRCTARGTYSILSVVASNPSTTASSFAASTWVAYGLRVSGS